MNPAPGLVFVNFAWELRDESAVVDAYFGEYAKRGLVIEWAPIVIGRPVYCVRVPLGKELDFLEEILQEPDVRSADLIGRPTLSTAPLPTSQ